jgi:hypothetical protein
MLFFLQPLLLLQPCSFAATTLKIARYGSAAVTLTLGGTDASDTAERTVGQADGGGYNLIRLPAVNTFGLTHAAGCCLGLAVEAAVKHSWVVTSAGCVAETRDTSVGLESCVQANN